MDKINDLLDTLETDINITYIYKKKIITSNNRIKNSTNDIIYNLDDVFLFSKKYTSINKLKTKNFDSLLQDKRLKNINLVSKTSFYKKLLLSLSWKITITWNPISIFSKKNLFSKKFFKNLSFIFAIIFIFLFIDKLIIENRINSWYKKLLSISENSWDINSVTKKINNSKFDFILADILYIPLKFIPNNNIKNWYYIIQWWRYLTKFLDKFIQVYVATKEFIDKSWWIENIELTNLLNNLRGDYNDLLWLLYSTILSYEQIWVLNDDKLNNKLDYTKNKLTSTYKLLDVLNKDFDIFLNILGNKKEKKYLVLFQNNDEIRATWWFIWSLATITIKNWKIIDFSKDDIYAYEWEINKVFKNKESAPEWLNQITDTFWLRDSNYYIDFAKSSDSIIFFLKKINKNIDWLIYINQKTFLDFLKYTWWIQFDQLWWEINDKNFSLVISTLVEWQAFKVWTLGTPKKILFDFANEFLNIIKEKKDYFAYMDIILKNIKSRDLVLYSFNPEENNLLWKLWLNWKINYSDTLDFNYPVYTNIGWNKSDRYIDIKYKKQIELNADCSINTNLNIYRTHLFSKKQEQEVINLLNKYQIKDKTNKDIINIQWKWVNKAYIRVVLPKNIIIENQKWLNINKYKNTTVVDFYINTRLLEESNYNFNYKILNKECLEYSYKLYKQPWIRTFDIELNNLWIYWNDNNLLKLKWIEWDYIY